MNEASFKPSLGLESILGPDISYDSESFLLFLKAYYEWLQTTKITLSNKSGTFVRGEIIVGDTSGAEAKIEEVGDDYIVVKVTSRTVFSNAETITGQTSSATATVYGLKDNVVKESGNLVNYRNLDTSIDKYVEYLRDELYQSIPLRYFGDKRLIATKFRSFFESRSNEDSYRFLFKLLYNENIDFYYPGEDVLRVSAGEFEKTQIIRAAVIPEIFSFLNKNIRGVTTGYFANVVDIKTFFIDGIEVAEMTLKLVSGVFQEGESIVAVDDPTLTTTLYGIIAGFQIVDAGSGYEAGDEIIISGDGGEAKAIVSSIKESPISALLVNQVGYGYQLGTEATINNAGTGGSDLLVRVTEITDTYDVTSGANTYTVGEISKVQILNRGSGYYKAPTITLVDAEIQSLGLLSSKLITINNAGSNYGVGNTINITGGSGANATGIIASVVEATSYDFLFEDGQGMILDGSYEDVLKNEDWNVLGPIARIELTNFGSGYTNASLPSITVNSTTGSNANIVFTGIQGTNANVAVDVANNIAGIGSIRAIEVTNFGINYTTATADATGAGDGNANVIPIIDGLGVKEGVWVNDKGKVDYKYIQDSYFYQDFSYVIKSGLTFNYYKDILKKVIHPVGLQMFGEILIQDFIDVTPRMSTEIESLRSIERYLVYILSQFTVSADISPYSSTTLILEPPAISLVTDLLDGHEYRIEVVCGGGENRQNIVVGASATPGPVLYLASPILDAAIAAELRIELGEKVFTQILQILIDLDMQTIVEQSKTSLFIANELQTLFQSFKEWKVNVEPQPINVSTGYQTAPVTKLLVSYTQTLPGYGYLTYGELRLGNQGGVVEEDFPNTDIFALADITFNTPYYENPANQTVWTQYVDDEISVGVTAGTILRFDIQSPSSIDYAIVLSDVQVVQSELKVVYEIVEFLDIAIPVPVTSLTEQRVVTLNNDSVIEANREIQVKSFNIEVVENQTNSVTSRFVQTFETLEVTNWNTSMEQKVITLAEPTLVQDYKEVILKVVDSAITDLQANSVLNHLVESYSSTGMGTTAGQLNKYQQIAGTVSYIAGSSYGTLTVGDFATATIGSVAAATFDETIALTVGNGTNFTSDFSIGDVFVVNDEYFTVRVIFSDTNLVGDRTPISTYTNAYAYKLVA